MHPEVDLVEHTCKTCKYNFGEICAAHDSLYGYGGEITDYTATCGFWRISYPAYEEARKIKKIGAFIIENKDIHYTSLMKEGDSLMMSHKCLSQLIDLIGEMNKKDDEIQNVFETTSADLLSKYTERLRDIIYTEIEIPEDNTDEMVKLYGDQEGLDHEDCFCRDFLSDWFYSFRIGEITKEKLIFNLLNWKSVS